MKNKIGWAGVILGTVALAVGIVVLWRAEALLPRTLCRIEWRIFPNGPGSHPTVIQGQVPTLIKYFTPNTTLPGVETSMGEGGRFYRIVSKVPNLGVRIADVTYLERLLHLSSRRYAWVGEVRYTGMVLGSFFQATACFPDASGEIAVGGDQPPKGTLRRFPENLPATGPFRLEGDSGWRPFFVFCDSSGIEPLPVILDLSLCLSGPGEIEIRNLRLIQNPDVEALSSSSGWSGARIGWIGGWCGMILGLLGASAGIAATIWRSRRVRQEAELRRIVSRDVAER